MCPPAARLEFGEALMLRVTTIYANTAGASARYYTHYLADDTPDGEGRWLGRQADGLGLSGGVSTEGLEALLSGRDPVSGTRLGNRLVDRVDAKGKLIPAVAGYDATFSAPKSVSLWWGLTGDPGIVEAHDIAVRAVLDHLERYGATTRVRVNGSRLHPDTGGLIAAAFPQATSREDDPQLHTHVVISAKVQTADGRWLALDGRYAKGKQRPMGGLYQSVLRAELTHRYGVAWGPIVNGQAEIAGVPEELLAAFSKRTAQVDAALDAKIADFRERQGRDPTRWERAALTREAAADSRSAKTHTPTGNLTERWLDEAAALGSTPDRLVAAMRAAARDTPEPSAGVAVADVLELLSAGGSAWMRADVLQAVCDLARPVSQLSGRDWATAVDQACGRVMAAGVDLDPDTGGPTRGSDGRSVWLAPVEAHLTHQAVLDQEERILAFAAAHDQPATPSLTVDGDGLDVLQADAAAAVAGHSRLVVVVGPAGTGKTTALRRAGDDLRRQGRVVFGVTPTAKAAKVLRDEAGMAADTVAKLLHEFAGGRPRPDYRLPAGATVVVDEAGMCGTATLDRLIALAVSQQWRLVLVGDPRQLHAVGRGGIFDELCRTHPTHNLAVAHRFRDPSERRASLQLRAANPAALDHYFHHDRVAAGTFTELASRAAQQWEAHTAGGRSVAVVAETNEHVDALNSAIQATRRQTGCLGDRAVRVAGSEIAQEGDIVVTRRNNRTLRTDRGEPVRNRDRWKVSAVHDDASLTVSHLDGHGTIRLPADYARGHLRLGYAATAHGHQGDTVDVSLTIVTDATTHRSLYVGATRGRTENHLLVVAEPDVARDVLERVLANDRADIPAVVQRRSLARAVPESTGSAAATDDAAIRREHDDAQRAAAPHLGGIDTARQRLREAEAARDEVFGKAEAAPFWRRRTRLRQLDEAAGAVEEAEAELHEAERRVRPARQRLYTTEEAFPGSWRDAPYRSAELQRQLPEQLPEPLPPPTQRFATRHAGRDHGAEIEPPGIEL